MATLHEAGTDGARNAAGHTIYAAVEVSRKSWTVALHTPDAGRIGLHTVPAADTAAVLLVREVFCRGFRNRRELAGWAGLAPAPWASGEVVRSQGIDKAGPPWLRAQMLQLAWRWLRHQPESALSQWFRARAGTSGGRVRRVFVVALARKLLVALWRYATTGMAPDGAALA